jgi:hypothetical protein
MLQNKKTFKFETMTNEKNSFLEILDIFAIFISSLIAFLSPSFAIIGALITVCFLDHIFAIWKVKKLNEKFNFIKGMGDTITKALLYSLVIFVSYMADRFFINDIIILFAGKLEIQLVFTKIIALFLLSGEAMSINRHYKAVKGESIVASLLTMIKKGRQLSKDIKSIKENIKV